MYTLQKFNATDNDIWGGGAGGGGYTCNFCIVKSRLIELPIFIPHVIGSISTSVHKHVF